MVVIYFLSFVAWTATSLLVPGIAGPNGFSLTTCLIPRTQIVSGGPSRDGIPALNAPAMVSADAGSYLADDDRIVGISIQGDVRAYPIKILAWHEVVNDVVGGVPIVVTYCPLCQSVFVFDRRFDDGVRVFGVSGLLYNSNVLMFDRQPEGRESLWSQAQMRAVTGPAAEEEAHLTVLPSELTSWRDWVERLPYTRVMSLQTGYSRSYMRPAYAEYFATDSLMFPVELKTARPPGRQNKDLLAVVYAGGMARAYAFEDVVESAGRNGILTDRIGDIEVRLRPILEVGSIRIEPVEDVIPLSTAYMFWFTLSAMQPETSLFPLPTMH